MSWADYAAAHPWWTVLYVIIGGWSCSRIMAAAVEPLKSWRRPQDCPRCNGTGRLP